MHRLSAFKYILPLVVFVGAYWSFSHRGWNTFVPIIYAFIFIPLLELMLKPDSRNLSATEEHLAKNDPFYDWFLYIIVPLQWLSVFFFLYTLKKDISNIDTLSLVGRIGSMGLLCGVFGINVGHELGHRVKAVERFLAKALLLTSLYIHFYVEHNKGHHKNVATKEDPSSARYGEIIYLFYFRTIIYSYISAWKIAAADLRKKRALIFNWQNEMIQYHLIQLLFLAAIWYLCGTTILFYYITAAFIGILLLETVNYIEHYGLERKQKDSGQYERTMPWHSWNSDHVIGRLMLFELSRHSDHHYLASRKYQVLRHFDDSPQMPTGYPGMMILSLIPPLWFRVMNKRITAIKQMRPD
jgi:alkane 1-monooxygenase